MAIAVFNTLALIIMHFKGKDDSRINIFTFGWLKILKDKLKCMRVCQFAKQPKNMLLCGFLAAKIQT